MRKLEYIKLALKEKKYVSQEWIIRCFAICRPDDNLKNLYYLKPILHPFGFGFINSNNIFEKFDEACDITQPLFKFSDKIMADSSWAENIKTPIETSLGNLIINGIAVLSTFGSKFPFMTGQLSIPVYEKYIVSKLKDTPIDDNRLDSDIYVDEYVKFTDAMLFVRTLASIVSTSTTEKNITPPTGIDEFKKELVKKYEGRLHNAVDLSKFEGELKDFDNAYMAGDPSDGKFTKGKIKNVSRKKMFLTLGRELSFDDDNDQKPIIQSLKDGWSTDPDDLTAMVNGSRVGSFYRGAETVKGGVAAKTLLRAANNFTISDTDCESKLGMKRIYDNNNISQIIGKNIIIKTETILISDEQTALSLIGKELTVRSPMYCRLNGDTICKVCAGDKLALLPTGISIPLTEISSIILAASMKRMHGTVLSTAKISLDKHFT